MAGQSSGKSTEEVCREIKKIEDNNQYSGGSGPAINNLPAVRGGEDMFKKKKSYGG